MNPHTFKRLQQVHPELKRRAEILIARLAEQGITVEVVQGLREERSRMRNAGNQITITDWLLICALLWMAVRIGKRLLPFGRP